MKLNPKKTPFFRFSLFSQGGQTSQRRSGQVILLSVLILGGVMIGASAIAGLLLMYQIRQVNDTVSSAKALFAADAGLEVVTWCAFKPNECNDADLGSTNDAENPPQVIFSDSSTSFETTYKSPTPSTIEIGSRGVSGNTVRILETMFIFE